MTDQRRRRHRGRKTAVALVVLATAGATGVALTRGSSSQAAGDAPRAVPANTAEVTRQTLKDTDTADGELGYGTTTTVTSRLAGTVTSVPESGQQISRGQPLFAVDDDPVTLMYGALPAYRRLADGSEGADVQQLEQNLYALGYTGFTVDDEYTSATAEAVEEWQEDLGLEETGAVELGQVVFAPAAVRVDSLAVETGQPMAPGGSVLSYTGTAKAVTVELEASDQRLVKKGAAVTVTLPDDSTVTGRIDEVATIIEPAAGQGEEPTTKVEVLVGVKDQKAPAAYALASVDVTFTAAERKNVLTVPVSALLALREGGFGVEVVDATGSRYVPVKTGLFAAGRVEISGAGIAAGTDVGVPQ
jgi:multidrug efflux system membrane fusion protein